MATQIHPHLADQLPETGSTVQARGRRERTNRTPVEPLRHRWYRSCKAAADFLLATVLTIPALPIVALAALLIKLTSRGPAFYSQIRVGKDGKLFAILKLRTMRHNCESLTGALWCVPGDPRITPVGWFLRTTHLDELPQILNVLRGEMSLIGPRPERPEFIPELEKALPAYRQRLNVRPGVTGLAQVQLPPDTDVDSVRRKLAHDLYYIRHLSPWMDLKLFICTAFYAVGVSYSVTSRLLGLPRSNAIERGMRDLVQDTPLLVRTRQAA